MLYHHHHINHAHFVSSSLLYVICVKLTKMTSLKLNGQNDQSQIKWPKLLVISAKNNSTL